MEATPQIRIAALNAAALINSKNVTGHSASDTINLAEEFVAYIMGNKISTVAQPSADPASAKPSAPPEEPKKSAENNQQPAAPSTPAPQNDKPANAGSNQNSKSARPKKDPNSIVSAPQIEYIKDLCGALKMPTAAQDSILASLKNYGEASSVIDSLKPRVTNEAMKAYKQEKQRIAASAAA